MTQVTYDRYYKHYIVISFKSSSVRFYIYDDFCYLACFGSGEREQGHGTEVLNACRRLARKLKLSLQLDADPYPLNNQQPYPIERLVEYYKKRGFKPVGEMRYGKQKMEYTL